MTAYMYIVQCADGSYYVGSTRNVDARVHQHSVGLGAEYTRRRRPIELKFVAEFENVAEAFSMEKRVQGWSRAKRKALIDGAYDQLPGLSRRGFRPSTESGDG